MKDFLRQTIILVLTLMLIISVGGAVLIKDTSAYFIDDVNSSDNVFSSGIWVPTLLTPRDEAVINGAFVEQAWSPIAGATKYTYQSCHNDPDVAPCVLRWLSEYPAGSPEFSAAKKSAAGVGNATYWWRVKATIGAFEGPWSEAWKITVDNTHPNKVVINEFLPDPIGNDDAPMPDGEWVELYNNKGQDVNVAGWVLYDNINTHALPITILNTKTGSTIIRSGDFLVVYRNGDSDFSIDNDADTMRLFTNYISTGTLVDSYTYAYPGPGDKPENWSYARVPDGSITWVDPIPTPGEPNIAGNELPIEEPKLSDSEETEEISGQVAQEVIETAFDVVQAASASDDEIFAPVASGSDEVIASGSADETLVPTGSDAADVASPSFEIIASESISEEETLVPPAEEIVASGSESTQEQTEQASTVVPVTENAVTTEEPVTESVESVESIEPATEEQAAPDASESEAEPAQGEEAPQSPVIVPEPVSVDLPAPAPAPEPETPAPSAPVEVPAPAVPDAAPAAE